MGAAESSNASGLGRAVRAHRGAGGDITLSRAFFTPQREHFMSRRICANVPVPNALATSNPPSVREWPQPAQSIWSPQLKRTRSAADRTCFVDIPRR